jgi:hypothetical protein
MKPLRILVLSSTLAATLWAQQFQFNLDHLASKASDTVDLSLNTSLLNFAGKFLNGKDPDEAKVKKLIVGITGIYIKSFEFKQDGAYVPADLDRVRSQLKSPEWSRIVGVKSEGSEHIEVWARSENGKISGIAILASEPRQLTVANIVGNVDLESLADLGGHFGLPELPKMKKKKARRILPRVWPASSPQPAPVSPSIGPIPPRSPVSGRDSRLQIF